MFRRLLAAATRRRADHARANRNNVHHRRIAFEPLEDRRLLSVMTPLNDPLGGFAPLSAPLATPTSMELVSRADPSMLSDSAGGESSLSQGSVSADGRYVAFQSNAPNLVAGLDIVPGVYNVYRLDRVTGEIDLVSVNSDGTGSANGWCSTPVISAEGTVVAFVSGASNLHPLDTDTGWDVFARDLTTGTTHLVSVNTAGTGSGNGTSSQPVISADGAVVAFQSTASDLHVHDMDTIADIFVRDLSTGTTHLVSVDSIGTGSGNNLSDRPVISADGTVVAFRSYASNLHALDADSDSDIFARNLTTGTTHLVSVNTAGTGSGNGESSSPVISAGGTVVAFRSYASNLHALPAGSMEDVFARDLTTNTTHLVLNQANSEACA